MSASLPAETLRIKAVYGHLDCLLTAIERLKHSGFQGFQVTSPLPRHEIEEALYEGRPSPVRWWTLTGAVTGIVSGFGITSLTAAAWPMANPGGKPVVSLPTFAVIMFECTILFGGLCTFIGMIVHTGLPAWGIDKALQDPRFSDDKFGLVFTGANPGDRERIVAILQATGAVEVTTGDATVYEVPNA